MHVLTVVGARPQFVKAAAVSRVLRARHRETLVHTGQHYDDAMSAIFFRELELPPPDHDLGVGSGPHAAQTAAMLAGLEPLIARAAPDWVLVYGDTNSTLAGALAAAKLNVPVAHVEAGLRSFDRRMPEEVNRIVADAVATLLLAPGEAALRNLAAEGLAARAVDVGDVMRDALDHAAARAAAGGALARHGVAPGGYYLATVHRACNTDDPARLGAIVAALAQLDRPVIFPVHPRTRAALAAAGLAPGGALRCVEPAGYLDMVALERGARAILTDSGGVQKEAYWLGVPCVTLREETEWVETVAAGWNVLAGADPARIVAAVRELAPPAGRPALYGDGRAAGRVVAALEASRALN